ncbi:MAG: tRNA pseudouridine synthase B [Candidatus Magasanikbacteria bacterium GW2011_GWC2_37_14]|uniref:tRNA pseudouridine synthase B n=1 Tax=Candidatus Magasanikbacteria bacterium GW2011_GWC2_37_14 TaxID=1619046 RepID=A0A0G0GCP0_9BACT|nr:MAG: tRNA pseudouridine synthase B [Candidatus Magasanikbacteria bacterium GW2011_GWC2_37_14]
MLNNFLLINKPSGWTSFDVVAYVRKMARKQNQGIATSADANRLPRNDKIKVGHAGTLDPFATGLLIVGVGREATKRLDEFKNLPKTYVATIKLGSVSDTFDKTGTIIIPLKKGGIRGLFAKIFTNNPPHPPLPRGVIERVLKKFIGKIKQMPPMYSAKKINGQKLYNLARKGITVKRKKNKIQIYNLKLLDYNYPTLKIEVECSAGTYIRTLANDIGKKLGCGAYCEELERTKIGEYKLADAKTPDNCHSELAFDLSSRRKVSGSFGMLKPVCR